MRNKLIQELENKNIDEIIALKNDYPFVALFHMVAAKKAKQNQHYQQEDFTASASLRVPSRQVLKDYLNIEKQTYQPKTQLEKVLFAPFLQAPKFFSNKQETQREKNIEQQQFTEKQSPIVEEDSFEVELYHYEEKNDKEANSELNDENEETIIDDTIEVERYHFEEEFEQKNDILKEQLEEATQENQVEVSVHPYVESTENKSPIDLTENEEIDTKESKESILSEKQIIELQEQEIQQLPQEMPINLEEQEEIEPTQVVSTLTEDDFNQLEKSTNHNNQNTQTVEELTTAQNNSVYKRVVEILKDDKADAPNQNDISDILLEENTTHKILENETVEEFLVKHQENNEEYDDSDETLDRLYQEAAYVQEIEQEIKEMQEQNIGAGQPADSKQKFSFMSWLNSFSDAEKIEQQKEQFETEETTSVATKDRTDAASKEIEYQYRDSEEDLNDETSRHVQEIAMKSMQKDESFYTETLAVIYTMQEKYEQAIEVYERLAVINSEKSSYFADQIKKIKENLD